MRRAITVTGVLTLAALCGACSSNGPSAAARRAFVDAHASALCAVKDHKFPDQHAQESAYLTAVKHIDISAADLRKLAHAMESDPSLRQAITDRVAATCR